MTKYPQLRGQIIAFTIKHDSPLIRGDLIFLHLFISRVYFYRWRRRERNISSAKLSVSCAYHIIIIYRLISYHLIAHE